MNISLYHAINVTFIPHQVIRKKIRSNSSLQGGHRRLLWSEECLPEAARARRRAAVILPGGDPEVPLPPLQ